MLPVQHQKPIHILQGNATNRKEHKTVLKSTKNCLPKGGEWVHYAQNKSQFSFTNFHCQLKSTQFLIIKLFKNYQCLEEPNRKANKFILLSKFIEKIFKLAVPRKTIANLWNRSNRFARKFESKHAFLWKCADKSTKSK